MVFNIADLIELKENMDKQSYRSYIVYLKRVFKEAIIDLIPEENIVMLHDHGSDGITFLMRIRRYGKKPKELDDTIFEIVMYVTNEIS